MPSSDLEARIADLDERLRQARAESTASTYSGKVERTSSATSVHHDANLGSPLPAQPGTIWSPGTRQLPSTSPWRDVGKRTLRAEDEELTRLVDGQRSYASALDSRLHDTYSKIRATNTAVASSDMELSRHQRNQDVARAQSIRAIDDAERRLIDVEKDSKNLQQVAVDIEGQKELLARQLEDTRCATRRAEVRLNELQKDEGAAERKLKEQLAAVREINRRSADDESSSLAAKRRLQQRVAELTEDNKMLSERLRKMEAQYSLQQQEWVRDEHQLRDEIETSNSQLHDIQLRLRAAELDLQEREAEAEVQRSQRDQRQNDLIARRVSEGEQEAARLAADAAVQENVIRQERESSLAFLRQQLDETHLQIERKKRVRDAQLEAVQEMKRQISQLQQALSEKERTATECQALEKEISHLDDAMIQQRSEASALKANIDSAQADLASLRSQSKRLKERLDEESMLKQQIASVARELSNAELIHAEELAALERGERDIVEEKMTLQGQLDSVNAEVDRIHLDATTEMEALSRKISAVRQDVLDKEAELQTLIGENAIKQSTIGQLEEERRRLEREQLSRKASAAQAARAALSELAM